MRIYFSGIGGVGIGPLAEIAHDAGYDVLGSDMNESQITNQLQERGIFVGFDQDGSALRKAHFEQKIDWFVYTAALPEDHPELAFAKDHGIKISKRDELLAQIIRDKNLKLIAVSGTHGKTTTTGMLVWAFHELGLPLSYSVGSTLGFAPSGQFNQESGYFVYECDEYDRNFLSFEPHLSIIPALDYDHPDTYKNQHVYKDAFVQFMEQSATTLLWEKDLRFLAQPDIAATYEAYDDLMNLSFLTMPGNHMRQNAFLVIKALQKLNLVQQDESHLVSVLNSFPGTGRRFEKLADNLYSDYGHHPVEIAATLQLARELSDYVVLVYQPHQNTRQHEVREQYKDSMLQADEIYWLPTYLTRENKDLPVLTPKELSFELSNNSSVHLGELDDNLWQHINRHRSSGHLVIAMGAGTIDAWIREKLQSDRPQIQPR